VITDQVAALSCGIYEGLPVADLDYDEDSVADTDGNFVMTGSGKLVEIQATAEGAAFDEAEFMTLMTLAKNGIGELVALQKQAVGL
jgi:ribonuclease PH